MQENKSKEEIIKYHKNKRKKHKIKLALITTFLIFIGLILIGMYYIVNKEDSIKYKETSEVKYGINLIENEFYDEYYLEEGTGVISNLIKNIDAEFKYNLELEEDLEYKYNYKILAEIDVKERAKSNSIYKTEHEIFNKEEQESVSNNLEIAEKININYNEYNEQINKLLEIYKLSNTTSELQLNFYLNVINKVTGEQINKEEKVMSLQMPLATSAVEITVNENVKDFQGEILLQKNEFQNSQYMLIIGVVALILGLITLVRLIKYISDTRSAEKMYDDEIRKILFDYKSYIQKINNMVDYNDYKVVKIDTFKELLGMKEELKSTILMYTEEDRKTTFMIINGNLLFEYILEARLIREKLIQKSKEKTKKGRNNEKNK